MRALILLGAALSLALACGPKPAPLPPNGAGGTSPIDNYGGSGGQGPTTPCEAAQATLIRLGCQEASTPRGISFGDACARAEFDGRNWHPECIATIQACSEVELAYRGELCR